MCCIYSHMFSPLPPARMSLFYAEGDFTHFRGSPCKGCSEIPKSYVCFWSVFTTPAPCPSILLSFSASSPCHHMLRMQIYSLLRMLFPETQSYCSWRYQDGIGCWVLGRGGERGPLLSSRLTLSLPFCSLSLQARKDPWTVLLDPLWL